MPQKDRIGLMVIRLFCDFGVLGFLSSHPNLNYLGKTDSEVPHRIFVTYSALLAVGVWCCIGVYVGVFVVNW